MSSLPEVPRFSLSAPVLATLAIPAALCIVGWCIQASVLYPTGSRFGSLTALAFVGGSFLSIIPVSILAAGVTKDHLSRRWPVFLLLGLSLLTLVPAVFVSLALLFRN
jgi:hypothetical protein